MSRTRRDYGPYVNPEEWICPWQAIGDHHPCFFSAHPKKYIKQLTSSAHRAKERIILHSYQYSEDGDDDIIITSYKKNADPWDIDWFRD